jgi:2-dehydro-3-deoxyphosphooctonate aldolase (KDO 8-P synthase)
MKLAGFEVGNSKPIFLITGPCVSESESFVLDVAAKLSVDWKQHAAEV